MRIKFPGLQRVKAPSEGSAAPIIALVVLAALGAAVTLWLRSEDAQERSERNLSPTSGMPAVPAPRATPSAGPGV